MNKESYIGKMKTTILLVEDNPEASKVIRKELVRGNAFVLVASNLDEACRLLNSRSDIDGVLTDLDLDEDDSQNVDGYQVVRLADHRGIPRKLYSSQHQTNINKPDSLSDLTVHDYNDSDLSSSIVREGEKKKVVRFNRHIRRFTELRDEHNAIAPADFEKIMEETKDYFLDVERLDEVAGAGEKFAIKLIDSSLIDKLHINILYIVIEHDDCVLVEVYGLPSLYAIGESEIAALSNLIQLMAGYHHYFMSDGTKSINEAFRIKEYLDRVFNDAA